MPDEEREARGACSQSNSLSLFDGSPRKVALIAFFAAALHPVRVMGQSTDVPDLSGRWDDDGRPVEIEQSGTSVVARFVEPPLCDPQDGSTPRPRELDFEGALGANDTIRGKASVCNYGERWGSEIGIQEVDAWLVLEEEGAALRGEYEGWRGWAPIELTRECRGTPWPEPAQEPADPSREGPDLPAGFMVVRRAPIEFEPFRSEDLGPCRFPDEEVTLPNGARMTLARYLTLLNRHERRLNDLGITLRGTDSSEPSTTATEPSNVPALVRPAMDATRVADQSRLALEGSTKLAGPAPELKSVIERARAARGGAIGLRRSTDPPRPVLAAAADGLVTIEDARGRVERWNVPLGEPSTFYVGLDGEFRLLGAPDRTTLEFHTGAEGSIVGNRADLLGLSAEIVSPTSEPMSMALDLRVLGEEYALVRETLSGPEDMTGTKVVPVEASWKTSFTIAGVGIDARLGVRGESGLGFFASLLPGSLIFVSGPYASAKAFVEANADVEIGRVSAGSNLTLLDWQLILWAAAQLQVDESQRPYVWMEAYGLNELTALDGDAWIEACYWVLDWKGWHEKCQRVELWDVLGTRSSDYLFQGSDTIYLD